MTHAMTCKLWQARVADYYASELTVREWCQQNKVALSSLEYWIRKVRKSTQMPTGTPKSWACVKLADESIANATNLPARPVDPDQTLPNGVGILLRVGEVSIELRPGFDASLLSDVLKVVVASC